MQRRTFQTFKTRCLSGHRKYQWLANMLTILVGCGYAGIPSARCLRLMERRYRMPVFWIFWLLQTTFLSSSKTGAWYFGGHFCNDSWSSCLDFGTGFSDSSEVWNSNLLKIIAWQLIDLFGLWGQLHPLKPGLMFKLIERGGGKSGIATEYASATRIVGLVWGNDLLL